MIMNKYIDFCHVALAVVVAVDFAEIFFHFCLRIRHLFIDRSGSVDGLRDRCQECERVKTKQINKQETNITSDRFFRFFRFVPFWLCCLFVDRVLL